MRVSYDARTLAACAACVLMLVACASPPPSGRQAASAVVARQAFGASGRLSARHRNDAFAANFRWQHSTAHDELELASPLGQTVAQLSGTGGEVELRTADGKTLTAADWPALTARGLGWPLPVDGLVYWIQGVAGDATASTVELGADGLPSVIRQDGWVIAYQSFSAGDDGVSRPARLTLSYPEVELRLVIDRWQ